MQKRKVKSLYLFISSLVIGLFSFPFAFAKTVEKRSKQLLSATADSANYFASLKPTVISVYDSLHLNISGINRKVFEMAEKGYEKIIEEGRLLNDSIVSIIDFSLPSSAKRLYIVDLKNFEILFNTYVAHGRNSGKEFAKSFSNSESSFKSSPGFYITGNMYTGKHGKSLKLEGLEKGINDNAEKRAVVIHGADYVNESLIHSQGYIGRSQGCPAVSPKESNQIINTIKEGTCLFIYSPEESYQSKSVYLN
ncbi:MAG: murein L,D-transpeptidase catalytic domain family protein [Bacteroidetes bacterium]|nr:MAG: murein L,D-transpeptidase catalytic domain family protein [Bacteroidota bacterium]